jgi:hypothetical protein
MEFGHSTVVAAGALSHPERVAEGRVRAGAPKCIPALRGVPPREEAPYVNDVTGVARSSRTREALVISHAVEAAERLV